MSSYGKAGAGAADGVTVNGAASSSGASKFRSPSFLKWRRDEKSGAHGMNVDGEFKKWPHPAEALHKGKVTYVVKFLGFVNVDDPKGIDVVRGAIQKMKFNKSVKKAEGIKTAKKELVISVDSVTIQDPKYKIVDHSYPLHRISFCADDKTDKRMFAFIAKEETTKQHVCFVFDSEKCAEEITLTVGQAFEIAYNQFVEQQGRPSSIKDEMVKLKTQVAEYEKENQELKAKIKELESKLSEKGITTAAAAPAPAASVNGAAATNLIDTSEEKNGVDGTLPMSPAPHQQDPVVGRRLENLLFDEDEFFSSSFSSGSFSSSAAPAAAAPAAAAPAAAPIYASVSFAPTTSSAASKPSDDSVLPSLAPPPRPPRRQQPATPTPPAPTSGEDLFGAAPMPVETDVFGATPLASEPAMFGGGAAPSVAPTISSAPAEPDMFGAVPFVPPRAEANPFGADDLFGMSPFQAELQPSFKSPLDISFGSGNFASPTFPSSSLFNDQTTKTTSPPTNGTSSNPFLFFN